MRCVARLIFGRDAAGRGSLKLIFQRGSFGRRSRRAARRNAKGGERARVRFANGPTDRVQIVKLADRRHALLFNAHHLVCDGWSVTLCSAEMAAIYAAEREGGRMGCGCDADARLQRWEEELRQTPEFARKPNSGAKNPCRAAECKYGRRPHPSGAVISREGSHDAAWRAFAGTCENGRKAWGYFFYVLLAAYKTLLFRLTARRPEHRRPVRGQNSPGGENLVDTA